MPAIAIILLKHIHIVLLIDRRWNGNLVSAGLFDKEIVPHEEYLEVNDNNQKMRTIVKLHDKYFEIRWTQYTHKDSEFPNDPVEVRKKPKIIDDWIPVEK